MFFVVCCLVLCTYSLLFVDICFFLNVCWLLLLLVVFNVLSLRAKVHVTISQVFVIWNCSFELDVILDSSLVVVVGWWLFLMLVVSCCLMLVGFRVHISYQLFAVDCRCLVYVVGGCCSGCVSVVI